MSAGAAPAVFTFDPYDYAFQEDPYPTYAWLRENAPLYRNEEQGFYALSRHADIYAAVRDDATYSNKMGVSIDPTSWGPQARYAMSFLAMDGPEQMRLRSLVSRGFTPRRVRELEPRIRQIASSYLDEAIERGSFDFIDDFAGKLPMDIISELVGVPVCDRAELRRLADLVVHRVEGTRDVPQEGIDAAMSLFGYYADMLAQRRAKPADDLTSALATVEVDGDRLSDSEILGFLFLMIVAGNETTTKLLGNCVYWGHRNPDQLATVFADPSRVSRWVEETLRYDASSQMVARYLLRDVELHGQAAPAGSQLLLLLGSGNHDPEVFPDPERYDLDRDTSQLVSFGGGRHYCLGANLARLETNAALAELVSRIGSLDVDEAAVQRVHSISVRGFAHLPVTMAAR